MQDRPHPTHRSQRMHALYVSGHTLTISIRVACADIWYDTRDYYGVTLAPAVAKPAGCRPAQQAFAAALLT